MGTLGNLPGQHEGIVNRCLKDIFCFLDAQKNKAENQENLELSLSFLQIYNEQVQDLLNPENDNLQLRENTSNLNGNTKATSKGVQIQGLTTHEIPTIEKALEIVEEGLKNRIISPTLMNSVSSRAHTVLSLTLKHYIYENEKLQSGELVESCLNILDLAGSERVKKTQSTGTRLEEAKMINKSLTVLGQVISGQYFSFHLIFPNSSCIYSFLQLEKKQLLQIQQSNTFHTEIPNLQEF